MYSLVLAANEIKNIIILLYKVCYLRLGKGRGEVNMRSDLMRLFLRHFMDTVELVGVTLNGDSISNKRSICLFDIESFNTHVY